jgi:hypothetical protein
MKATKYSLSIIVLLFCFCLPVQAQNQLGTSPKIAYLEGTGVPRTAWLEATSVVNPNNAVMSTSDSRWFVQNPANANPDGPNDWLTYLGADGTIWQAKIRCRWIQGSVKVWIESQRADGTQNHDSQDIYIVDPQGKKWHLSVAQWVNPGQVPVISLIP